MCPPGFDLQPAILIRVPPTVFDGRRKLRAFVPFVAGIARVDAVLREDGVHAAFRNCELELRRASIPRRTAHGVANPE